MRRAKDALFIALGPPAEHWDLNGALLEEPLGTGGQIRRDLRSA